MLFNSYAFILIFLPVVLGLYYLLGRFNYTKLATASLVAASLIFYAYWDLRYMPLLLMSICVNYFIGSGIERTKSKKLLGIGIAFNLTLLGYYKYAGFFLSSVDSLLGANFVIPNILLPLGISFFTFTQTAYLVDAYRGETKNYSFLTYLLFVTFFPHLIAGPILYHKHVIPQFMNKENYTFSDKNMAQGIVLFTIGLFKKVMIADNLSPWVKVVFDNADKVTMIEAWAGAIAYTMQLYFDFSGYSEMAVGLGLMLNIHLPWNFNSPYKAVSIIDFWRRWHITLSEFLKNYLYIPLGGNRNGEFKRMRNLLITMLLGGLWHGAGWNFVIWGGLHGVYLVVNHSWKKAGFELPRGLSWLITFLCVVVAWVFFRAETTDKALSILTAMAGINGIVISTKSAAISSLLTSIGVKVGKLPYLVNGLNEVLITVALIILVKTLPNPRELLEAYPSPKRSLAIVTFVILAACLTQLNKVSEFLYFQF